MNTTEQQVELNANEKQAQKIIINQVQQMMDLLLRHANKYCVDNSTGSIPFVVLKTSVDVMMKSFKEGAK